MMRAARIDDADAQLALGKAYLFGEVGLKINLLSALYWLHRAAANGQASACLLIGQRGSRADALLRMVRARLARGCTQCGAGHGEAYS